MPRILCVTAHPDDEAANFGGAIAMYSAAGVSCRLVCLTAGEAARNRGQAASSAELKQLRRAELAASCQLLGFESQEAWDYPDAHLPEAPLHEMAGRLVAAIRSDRPDLVLSMGPEGSVTAHPDHGMSGLAATAAFHWAAHERFFPELGLELHQAQRLWYATAPAQPPRFPKVWLPLPDAALAVQSQLERKIAAFRCHATQAPLFDRVEEILRLFGGIELYHLAAGAELPAAPTPAADLFAGL
ncbi:MAG: PIG-L deacetylase family protein [Terriglobales bacterium]